MEISVWHLYMDWQVVVVRTVSQVTKGTIITDQQEQVQELVQPQQCCMPSMGQSW